MLSTAELKYLDRSEGTSDHYSVVLKSRIRHKLQGIEEEFLLLAKDPRFRDQVGSIVTKIRDQVTENCDQTNDLSVNALNAEGSQRVEWRRGWESNPRVYALQAYS